MRPRFLADADLNQKILTGLRRREPAVDFQTPAEGGVMTLPDPEVLAVAARRGRILVTHDFRTMLRHVAQFAENQTSPGIIVVKQQLDIGTAIEDLLLIWAATLHEEWQNRAGFIPL